MRAVPRRRLPLQPFASLAAPELPQGKYAVRRRRQPVAPCPDSFSIREHTGKYGGYPSRSPDPPGSPPGPPTREGRARESAALGSLPTRNPHNGRVRAAFVRMWLGRPPCPGTGNSCAHAIVGRRPAAFPTTLRPASLLTRGLGRKAGPYRRCGFQPGRRRVSRPA